MQISFYSACAVVHASIAAFVQIISAATKKHGPWKGTAFCALITASIVSVQPCAAESGFDAGATVRVIPGTPDGTQLMSQFKTLALRTYRMEYRWDWVEHQKGEYRIDPAVDAFVRQSSAEGLQPLIVLGMGNSFYDSGGLPTSEAAQQAFADYAAYLAARYRGVVKHYEVWNEWNAGAGSVPHANKGD